MKRGGAILPLLLIPLAQAQDLPEGSGKDVTTKVCGGCHEAGVVTKYRNSRDEWESVVEDMRGRGADGSDEDFKAIVAYLTRYFGPAVKVNKAGAPELESQLGIAPGEAAAIVKYRKRKASSKISPISEKCPGWT